MPRKEAFILSALPQVRSSQKPTIHPLQLSNVAHGLLGSRAKENGLSPAKLLSAVCTPDFCYQLGAWTYARAPI